MNLIINGSIIFIKDSILFKELFNVRYTVSQFKPYPNTTTVKQQNILETICLNQLY